MNGLIRFISSQFLKTIKNPARLYIIPRSIVLRILFRFLGPVIRFIDKTPPILGIRLGRKLSSEYHFTEGHSHLNANRPREAWQHFKKCLGQSADPFYFTISAVCLTVGLGRYSEAMALFGRANALQAARAKKLGADTSSIRYLDPIWIAAFGHTAQLQYIIKLNILENRRKEDTVLYIPPDVPIANRFMLEQWRPYITITDDEEQLPLPLSTLRPLTFDFYAPMLSDGSTAYYWDAASRVHRQWLAEARGPLLTISPDIENRGIIALASVGIPPGAWFVTLHVREAGSKKHHIDLHNVLNSNISDYLAAITEITNRGGWVIRMGDPSMKPLPNLPNVLDYCHSTLRADWMDIFLLAKGRFFLGTSSGPTYVPAAYGVPSVLTNWWPYAQRPWDEKAIFLPKLYRQSRNGKPLTLSKAISEPFGYCNSIDHLKNTEGVTVEDNTSDDIRDAAIEMMERLDGTVQYDPADLSLRARAEAIFEIGGAHGFGTLARDYLRRNSSIVD
jgi:putative glycosyltransferase (TIGR04372 family)